MYHKSSRGLDLPGRLALQGVDSLNLLNHACAFGDFDFAL
jgi:hypothetical protein